jgi:hypothetical protein
MADAIEVCGASVGGGALGGAIAGGAAGFALCVWTSVKYIEPAFEGISGISPAGAKGITAAIDLLIGLELFIGAGMAAGAVAGMIVAPIGAGIGYCAAGAASKAKDVWNNTHCPSFSFFHRKNNNQPPAENVVRGPEAPMSPSARV